MLDSKNASKIIDANAEYRGVSVIELMGNAGRQACKVITKKWKLAGKKVQIFCGSGNNGGDGFALAAELLTRNIQPEIILAIPVSKIRTEAARYHFARVPKRYVQEYSKQTKINSDLIVDALLGVGATGKLKAPYAEIVRKIGQSKKPIVSLDVPTGDLKPKLIIAFHVSKNSKNEVVVPIGIPEIAETHFGPGDVQAYFPKREAKSHKGDNGRVIVIGGSKDYVGAPVFSALGAVAGGADLVYLWVPKINFAASRKFTPNVLVKTFAGDPEKLTPETVPEILDFAKKNPATLVLGPGLGRAPETEKAIREIVAKFPSMKTGEGGLVLDADALLPDIGQRIKNKGLRIKDKKLSSKEKNLILNPYKLNLPIVLTPHAGEFKRIKNWKLATGNWTLLKKGAIDEIISPTVTRYNDSGNAILTVGGTGDTLAGFVGAMLARGVPAFEAAGITAFLVGKAGEELALKYESITPQLLSSQLPKTIRRYQSQGI
jgi:NAD(P)H-hydrate epimerase